MIRYNCDMCGRSLVPEEDERYVVKIEVYSACDSMDADCEDEEFINDFEDDDDENDEDAKGILPAMLNGETMSRINIIATQKFANHPPKTSWVILLNQE